MRGEEELSSIVKSISIKVNELQSLNFLSPAVIEIINIIDKPGTKIDDLLPLILVDRVLCTNIFKYLSSAAFGMRRRPEDLREAINYLGLFGLKDLIFLIASHAYFKEYDEWYCNIFTAFCAKKLAERLGYNPQETSQIYMAALICDIGVLVLKKKYKQAYCEIDEKENLYDKINLENKKFGTNRVATSYELLSNYGLPEEILKIVKNQENEWTSENYRMENMLIDTAYELSYLDFADELDLDHILNSPRSVKYKLNEITLTSKAVRALHQQVRELLRF